MTCSCGEVKVGGVPTGSYNWNPDCQEHGVGTDWFQSEEQVRAREDASGRLVGIQLLAGEMRRYPRVPRVAPEVIRGFVEVNHETAGFSTYWYLWAAGSTYLLGDLYG